LESATQRAFAALYHEALHAWLENRAYPADEFDVPRWLNEGLAQIFEVSLSPWGELRLDGADAARRRALRTDLRGPQPLALATMLTAEPQQFLVEHGGGSPASQQHYLYAWGVTQYLVVDRHLLGTRALDDYLAGRHKGTDAVHRFEALIGEPLPDFERRWRRWLLGE
jgi:hypothetical protein